MARKILGFDVIALFFSDDFKKHLNWLKNYKNILISDNNNNDIYKRYIYYYNKEGLYKLKTDIDKNLKLKYDLILKEFTDDFIKYPKFINEGNFSDLNFSENSDYFRHVYIKNKYTGYYINMNKDGTLSLNKNNGNIWDITLDNEEITLFSNGYYLSIDNSEKVVGNKMMKIGNYKKFEDKYVIIFGNKNLTIEKDKSYKIIFKQCQIGRNEFFTFVDYFPEL